MDRTIQTRTLITLRDRIDDLMFRAMRTGDTALAASLEVASAAIEDAIQGRA